MRIRIFYHLFLVNHWRRTFEFHLEQMKKSALYDSCEKIHVGAVYEDERSLCELYSVLRSCDKVTLQFTRALATPPVIWRNPEVRLSHGRLAESETILRMVEHAQSFRADIIYLFLHSKGVTNPPMLKRGNFPYFVSRGLDRFASNEEAIEFVLMDTAIVVSNWRKYVKAIKTGRRFWYYMHNFFWCRGSFLRDFDFEEYIRLHRELAMPQHRSFLLDGDWNESRHVFSHFPIKLHAFTNGVELEAPPRTYIDVKI